MKAFSIIHLPVGIVAVDLEITWHQKNPINPKYLRNWWWL
jgi:hypothetical protein